MNEIQEEQQALLKMFPELRESGRCTMSAAQRKAVGERMKAYWAVQRASKANGAGEAGRKQGRKK